MTALSIAVAQLLLIRHGFSCGGSVVDGEEQLTGQYGSGTEEAVRAFQRAKGLTADGVIAADTWAALLGVKK
jgi:peptidoglycan hydrolase-like protein with peptidoglycan-binding domain